MNKDDPYNKDFYASILTYDQAFTELLERLTAAADAFEAATGRRVTRVMFFAGGGLSVDVEKGENPKETK